MRVAIRVDASLEIGTGHVMRCLTLADKLSEQSATVSFISRLLPGNVTDIIEQRGYSVCCLPYEPGAAKSESSLNHAHWLGVDWETDAEQTAAILRSELAGTDTLVIDSYALDHQWEKHIGELCGQLAVIDDLADRRHECDLLLDQNYFANNRQRYSQLVPTECATFLGPGHALIRDEFEAAAVSKRNRNGVIERVLVFYGGIDGAGLTLKTINAITQAGFSPITFDIVIGKMNPSRDEIESLCQEQANLNLYCQTDRMAELMSGADFALGGGGTTSWERCLMGLPSASVIMAANQESIVESLGVYGATINLGWHHLVDSEKIDACLINLISNPAQVNELAARSVELMTGYPLNEPHPFVSAICRSEKVAESGK